MKIKFDQAKLTEVDSAVDLDYMSQCGTPDDIPLPYLHYITPHQSMNQILRATHTQDTNTTNTVQLGLKLPNSDRLQQEFPLSSTIQDIIDYAQMKSGIDLTDCVVSMNGVTRTILNDKTLTLNQCNINVRTVLYFSLP